MCHRNPAPYGTAKAVPFQNLPGANLLLLRGRLLSCFLWSRRLMLGRGLRGFRFGCRCLFLALFHLLRLRFLLRQFGSLEALAARGDLGDPHRRVSLPVAAQLLILLLALVMEDEQLRPATLF